MNKCFSIKSSFKKETSKNEYMDMYFEAEKYYQKKLEKLESKFEEKDTIIIKQSSLIMHLIRNEQDFIEQLKSAGELNDELNKELEKGLELKESENKRGNKTSLPQLCVIM